MVYCPNCQSEHHGKHLVCPECNNELLENGGTTGPVAEAPDDSWVAVANLKGRRLAERAKQALDANNIPSMIVPQSFGSPFITPITSDGAEEISGVDDERLLMVPREYKDEAKLLMRSELKKELI